MILCTIWYFSNKICLPTSFAHDHHSRRPYKNRLLVMFMVFGVILNYYQPQYQSSHIDRRLVVFRYLWYFLIYVYISWNSPPLDCWHTIDLSLVVRNGVYVSSISTLTIYLSIPSSECDNNIILYFISKLVFPFYWLILWVLLFVILSLFFYCFEIILKCVLIL